MNPRPCELTLVFGDINQGKSAKVVQVVKEIFKHRTTKILSLIKSDSIAYSGFRRLNSYNELKAFCETGTGFAKFWDFESKPKEAPKKALSFLAQNFRNGILICEDSTSYLESYVPEEVKDWIINRKNYGVDIFLVYHFMLPLNRKFTTLYSNMILFKVPDNVKHNFNDYAKQYKDWDKVHEAWQKIQTSAPRSGYIQPHAEIVNGQIFYN
jgi:hypothetical protein